MIAGPFYLNMVPGGAPLVIHVSQYEPIHEIELRLVQYNGQLYEFAVNQGSDTYGLGFLLAKRPDGVEVELKLRHSAISVDSSGQHLKKPNSVYFESYNSGYDSELTEVAGDVICEAVIINTYTSGTDYDKDFYMKTGIRTANFIIRVEPSPNPKKKLTKIIIATPSAKTTYEEEETLDLTGMVVKGVYDDGSTAVITSYSTSPANGAVLSLGMTSVTVSYTYGNQTFTAKQEIVVKQKTSYDPNNDPDGINFREIKQALEDGNISSVVQVGDVRPKTVLSDGTEIEFIAVDVNDDRVVFALKTVLPKRAMHTEYNLIHGYPDTEMFAYLNGELFNKLPSALKDVISPMTKRYSYLIPNNVSTTDTNEGTSYLWLPSISNIVGYEPMIGKPSIRPEADEQFEYYNASTYTGGKYRGDIELNGRWTSTQGESKDWGNGEYHTSFFYMYKEISGTLNPYGRSSENTGNIVPHFIISK